ncbi:MULTISPECIES: hypothetical protein [Capnocytophaga]|uniref:Uncharacterized protein n=1 Tax=Capnocytophaga canimorsus TaxID=28188 RepID=A0AAC9Z397_9FLAO|nr:MULTISPECIES: hypothetical protein [Capnocytophaga]ATA93717.1 hypothetical protein CGC54_04875 [Capnocytophaga canimorsus]GIJ97664.1 hypothetical protein CAPN001_22330 [Capnocytophaga stomatis]GIM59488.1 hypothetical protein CAPN007_16970 [Capnocytophaga canimorsus]GJQ05047.1 hypothetical protein CAPN009_14620 [Capnocytophaga canimorsus]
MKYYKITENLDKVYGRQDFPNEKYDTSAPNSQQQLDWDEFPDFEPNFSNLYIPPLKHGTTDILSDMAISGKGFIMSEKLKNIFEEYNLGRGLHRFYPLNSFDCKTGKNLSDVHYYFLQVIDLQKNRDVNYINYAQSEFFLRESDIVKDRKNITISNYEDFFKIKQKYRGFSVCYDKLMMSVTFGQEDLDMFFFSRITDFFFSNIVISERLFNRLKEEKMLDNFMYKEVPIVVEKSYPKNETNTKRPGTTWSLLED